MDACLLRVRSEDGGVYGSYIVGRAWSRLGFDPFDLEFLSTSATDRMRIATLLAIGGKGRSIPLGEDETKRE